MTREEIVKALRCFASEDNCPVDECNKKCPYWMENDKFDIDNPNAEISDGHQLCCAAADMLEQDVPGWISVKDRLPEPNERVLAYFPGTRDSEAVILPSKGWAVNKFVSHWMSMPEPPKEEAK